MRISRIREFIVVAELKSFTRAAKRAYITQPVLSKHIREIENTLGTQLFERSAGGVQLTEAGKIFYKHAVAIVGEYKNASDEINALLAGNGQTISIGYLRDPARPILLPLCRWFEKHAPQYQVRLLSVEFENLNKILLTKQCDFLLTLDTSPDLRSTAHQIEPIFEESLVVVMSKSHHLAERASVTFADIARERHFVGKPNSIADLRIYTKSKLDSVPGALPSIDSDDVFTMIDMAEWNYGIGVVASHNRLIYQDRCAFVPIDDEEQFRFNFSAFWLKELCESTEGAKKVELFKRALEFVRDVYKEELADFGKA